MEEEAQASSAVAPAYRRNPADIDAMLSMVPTHAAESLLPNLPPEAREDALEMVAEYCLGINGQRKLDLWVKLAALLNEHHPGLAVQANDVKRFCVRYMIPNIVVARSYVMRAVIERGLSLDTLASTLDTRTKMEEDYEKYRAMIGKVEKDDTGKLVPLGPTASDMAAMAKAVIAANKLAAQELERYRVIPESKPKATIQVDNLNINVRETMSRLAGRPIDAKFKSSGDGGPSSSPPPV